MYKEMLEDQNWKNKNENYLFELQKFLDLVDNIEDEEMKKIIINQMIKCDRILTKISEETFEIIINEISK